MMPDGQQVPEMEVLSLQTAGYDPLAFHLRNLD